MYFLMQQFDWKYRSWTTVGESKYFLLRLLRAYALAL